MRGIWELGIAANMGSYACTGIRMDEMENRMQN